MGPRGKSTRVAIPVARGSAGAGRAADAVPVRVASVAASRGPGGGMAG